MTKPPSLGPLTETGRRLALAQAALGPKPPPSPAPASQAAKSAAARAVAGAVMARKAGRLAESVAALRRAAQLDPGNARIHLDLGTTLYSLHRYAEAVPCLLQAIRLDPKLALAHFHLGLALHALGREAEAAGPFEQAVALTPGLAEAHRRLGILRQGWRMNAQAAASFRAASAVTKNPAEALRDTARALRIEGRLAEAEATLRRARALDPGNLEIFDLLGGMYAEQGRFAEAETELREALRRDPARPLALMELFQFARAQDGDREMLAQAAARAERADTTPQERMLLHFALGRAFEQLRDFATAIRHFDAANALRAGMAPLDRPALTRQVERLIAAFPEAAPAQPAGAADERPLFILGLPRSGTTLVEQIISSHPLVAAGGELGFWQQHGPRLLDSPCDDAALAPSAEAYRAVLAEISAEAARVTDKNPFNFTWIGLLARAMPGARFIHVRREPIDNAVSIYTTYLSSRRTFFLGNKDDFLFWYDGYRRLMDHWRRVVPPERLLEIGYEQLIEDREAETRRLVAFCGLDWDAACLRPEANRRSVNTASVWQARQPVYRASIGRWRNYAPWLGPLGRLAP